MGIGDSPAGSPFWLLAGEVSDGEAGPSSVLQGDISPHGKYLTECKAEISVSKIRMNKLSQLAAKNGDKMDNIPCFGPVFGEHHSERKGNWGGVTELKRM